MPTTATLLGRMKLEHPDMGFDAGATLEQKIKTIYTLLSDAMPSRFFTAENLADGASIDFEHNYKAAFAELGFRLYLWDSGTGELTRVNPTTGWTIAATPSFVTTKTRVTNNTGSSKTLALWLFQWPKVESLADLADIDLVTAAPEDGQAMVYSASLGKWVPGASGDSSFKLQGVTDPNATIKGGYLMLPDGRELATYDGAGSVSTDFGKDLTIDLDAILGGNPANATTYYVYVDLATLGAAVTCTDNGRQLYAVQQANFVLSTTAPEAMNRSRYVGRGFIRSATTGTVWSGSGAAFGTLAFLKAEQPPVAISPLVFSVAQQTVGAVGTSGQIRQGHLLTTKSFPAAALDTAKLSIYGMDNTPNDEYGTRNLTAAGSPAGTTGIFGATNEALALVGASSQRLHLTNVFFQPYASGGFSVGGWFKPTSVASLQYLMARYELTGDKRQWALRISAAGNLEAVVSVDGTSGTTTVINAGPVSAGAWLHVALVWTGSLIQVYANGKLASEVTFTAFANKDPAFEIGAAESSGYFTGSVDEVFYASTVVFSSHDIAKIASTRIDHGKKLSASRQLWQGRHYAAGVAPVTDLAGFVLDMSDADSAFVDLSQADPTDKIDLMLFDTGAAGAINVPISSAEFTFSATGQLTSGGSSYPTSLPEDARSIQGWQKTTNGWEPLDLAGMVWLTATAPRYLRGDIDTLAPSATNPVRIVVSTSASAQAVGNQTASNLVGMVDGSQPGKGIFLKRPDGTIRELAIDNSDNIVILDT